MARELDLTVETDRTEVVVRELSMVPGVVTLAVQHGASVEPTGDVVRLTATNAGARHVLRLIDTRERGDHGEDEETLGVATIAIREPLSVKVAGHHHELASENSEATLNDMEGQLRRESNPGLNFCILMLLAGGLASIGLTTDMVHIVIGAMVLAPGFEPFLRVPFALISGARGSVGRGFVSLLVGYVALGVGAAAVQLLLRVTDRTADLSELSLVQHWTAVEVTVLAVAVIAGFGGAVTVTAGRPEFTAGVMIALALIPTAAIVGMAAVEGDWALARTGVWRWTLDGLIVSATAVVVIGAKQVFLHRRRTQD